MLDVTYMTAEDIQQALREWALKVRGRPAKLLIVEARIREDTAIVSAEIEWGPEVDTSQRRGL